MFENPNETIGGGITALMVACNQNNVALAEELISRGADVNARDDEGLTALIYACLEGAGNCEIVALLLRNGADADVRVHGLKAINFARAAGHHQIVDLLEFA